MKEEREKERARTGSGQDLRFRLIFPSFCQRHTHLRVNQRRMAPVQHMQTPLLYHLCQQARFALCRQLELELEQ